MHTRGSVLMRLSLDGYRCKYFALARLEMAGEEVRALTEVRRVEDSTGREQNRNLTTQPIFSLPSTKENKVRVFKLKAREEQEPRPHWLPFLCKEKYMKTSPIQLMVSLVLHIGQDLLPQ